MRQIILITGTRKGIGRHLAEYYLSQENVVIGCSRFDSDLYHPNYKHFCLDIKDEKKVKDLFSYIKKTYGKLDILINNAGIASLNHSILTPLSTIEKLFQTNVFGCFLFSREASKLMKKNSFGRIINFSSIAVPINLEGEAIYAASKIAVEKLTKIMAKEVGNWGITINCIGPTPIDTDLIKAVPKSKIDKLLDQQAIKRLGSYVDVSNVIDFFIQKESSFITGQIIYLGGL
jgi:3-oxoacyl-[acyl-carrier protein] reductase